MVSLGKLVGLSLLVPDAKTYGDDAKKKHALRNCGGEFPDDFCVNRRVEVFAPCMQWAQCEGKRGRCACA